MISKAWNDNMTCMSRQMQSLKCVFTACLESLSHWELALSTHSVTTSYSPLLEGFFIMFLIWSRIRNLETCSLMCTSPNDYFLSIWYTYVMVNHFTSPTGTDPPGSGLAASCKRPAKFQRFTKALFSSVLLFFITQLQGIADLLKPQYCPGKTTY